jgi:hypothetical protein
MFRKSIEQMDRTELIGMVHVLQSQVEDLTSPERTRLYQLGKLHDQTEPVDNSETPRKTRSRLRRRLHLGLFSRKFAAR